VVGGTVDPLELPPDAADDLLALRDVFAVGRAGVLAQVHVPRIRVLHTHEDVETADVDGDVDEVGHALEFGGFGAELANLIDGESGGPDQGYQDHGDHGLAEAEFDFHRADTSEASGVNRAETAKARRCGRSGAGRT